MKLIVTPHNYDHAKTLISYGVPILHIGIDNYSLKSEAKFSFDEIEELTTNHPKVEIWVLVNKLMHHEDILVMPAFLAKLEEINVHGVVIADLGLLKTIKDHKFDLQINYDPEHLITNNYSLEFASNAGANIIAMSREINLDQMTQMNAGKKYQTMALVQGPYQILYSKRNLLTNYFAHQEQLNELEPNKMQKIYDEEREVYYQIFEDQNGTVMLGSEDVCMIDELDELNEANIEYLKIEGFLRDEDYINEVTKQYLLALALYEVDEDEYFDNCKQLKQNIVNLNPELPLAKGFYYKYSTYITKN